MRAILPIREWRCQDIDQVLLHEISRVFSSSEVLAKITSIRSKLPTAACWSWRKKERKLWSQLALCRKRLRYHVQTPQANHSQCSSPVETLNLIVESKSQPAASWIIRPLSYICRRGERTACNHIVLWILISLLQRDLIWPLMSRCVTTQVSVNSQIRVILKTSHFHFYWWRLIFK